MLRWSPRRHPDNEANQAEAATATYQEVLASSPRQPCYSETYAVTHWEHFEVDVGAITFCVRHWAATLSWPARYELSAHLQIGAAGGLQDLALGSRRPTLLWDVDASPPFSWAPPNPLPASEGCQQVDYTRKCVVTQFQAAQRGWKLTLMWLAPTSSQASQDARMPSKVIAQVQHQDGRRIVHPTNGRSFQIPLTDCPNPRSGHQAVPVVSPAMELSEARKELEQLRQQYQQCEALIVDRKREAEELQGQVTDLPSLERFAELEGRLDEESAHRRRCQVELLELRGRPRLFCVLLPGTDSQDERSIKRHSRSEVVVPSLWQNFEFDFIVESRDRGTYGEAWDEVKPVLDSALRRPASYACVLLASSEPAAPAHATSWCGPTSHKRHRAAIARMVDHLFECIADGVLITDSGVAASVSMVEVVSDDGNFRNLLQEGSAGLAVPDVRSLTARTSQEVMDTYELGMTKVSAKRGDIVLSICIQRYDASAREAACAARLAIAEVMRDEGCATSDSKVLAEKQLTNIAKVSQECMERTCEAWNAAHRPSAAVCSVPLQAKTLLVATVSADSKDLQASLPVLQLTAASSVLQERSSSKPDEYGCRRQLAKMLQENQRLRAELAERGRPTKQEDDTSCLTFRERRKMFEAPLEKIASLASSGARTAHSTPLLPSPRERYQDYNRAGSSGQRSCYTPAKDGCTSEGRRRMHATSCLLPSR